MSGVLPLLVAIGRTSPITIPSNWGVQGGGASPQTSVAKTLTVPSGSSGSLRFHITLAPAGTFQYIKNGGAAVGITQDLVVVFANADTLAFKLTGAGDIANSNVIDDGASFTTGSISLSTA